MRLVKSNSDFFSSVEHALTGIDPKWREYTGGLIVGSHEPANLQEKLDLIQRAREDKVPLLGICLGLQLMLVEYARNVLRLDANSTEIEPETPHPVIIKMPSMRVGIRPVTYKDTTTQESHWHNYRFNTDYNDMFKDWELVFSGEVLELARLKGHPYFMGTQFHPEYQSSSEKPHPILKEFIEKCKATAAGPRLLGR